MDFLSEGSSEIWLHHSMKTCHAASVCANSHVALTGGRRNAPLPLYLSWHHTNASSVSPALELLSNL
jgi:hypothetical protein